VSHSQSRNTSVQKRVRVTATRKTSRRAKLMAALHAVSRVERELVDVGHHRESSARRALALARKNITAVCRALEWKVRRG
jgi:hypothetical protein